MKGWVTPEALTGGTEEIVLVVPLDQTLRAALRGALLLLMDADNWEQVGDVEPTDCAAAFEPTFESLLIAENP